MIKIDFDINNTGNRIIQFLFGFILSEKKNCNLIFEPIEGFSQIKNITNREEKNYNFIHTRSYGHQNVDYDELIKHDGGIIVNSYVQKQYYYQEKEKLKNFTIPDEETDMVLSEKDIVIHIRLVDYASVGIEIPFDVYDSFIKEKNEVYDNFYIITDEPNSGIIKELIKNKKTKLVHENKLKDFDLLRKAKNALISQSSFSWLATYFGDANEIFVPLPSNENTPSMWKKNPKQDDIQLVDENKDKRYKIIYYEK